MRKVLAIGFIMLLVPSLCLAQGWVLNTSADILWARPSINWHDDEMSMKRKSTVGQFGITASSPQLSVKYSLTTGFGMADTIIPPMALFVGQTNFGKDPAATGQQKGQDKPVNVE